MVVAGKDPFFVSEGGSYWCKHLLFLGAQGPCHVSAGQSRWKCTWKLQQLRDFVPIGHVCLSVFFLALKRRSLSLLMAALRGDDM